MAMRNSRALVLWVGLCSLSVLWSCSSKPQLKNFESDGCSLFPDRSMITEEDWCECCFEHDIAYWQGGNEEQRKDADAKFKTCIEEKTRNPALAELMYNGVRLGGSPYFPTWYRWGYGWPHIRGYQALTPSDQKQISAKLQEFKAAAVEHACQK